MSGCVIETPADPKSDPKTEKEERVKAFHVVGTALSSEEARPDVLEEYLVSTYKNKLHFSHLGVNINFGHLTFIFFIFCVNASNQPEMSYFPS